MTFFSDNGIAFTKKMVQAGIFKAGDSMKRNLIFLLFLVMAKTCLAAVDPYYLNSPSCVIDRGNPERTGEFQGQPLLKLHGIAWINSTAQLTGNLVCMPNNNKTLIIASAFTGYDSKTGQLLWDNSSKTWVPFWISLAVYKNIIYTNDSDNAFSAFFANGQLAFNSNIKENLQNDNNGAPLIYNDTIFIPRSNSIIAYDFKTKKVIWRFYFPFYPRPLESSPLSTDGKRIYFGDWRKHFYAIDILTGKIVWKLDKIFVGGNSVSLSNRKVYIPANGGIYCLDSATGKILWFRILNIDSYTRSVAVTKNILIIPGNILYGLNPNTGGIIWSAPYSLYSFPVIVGNVVYFITYNNFKLYAIEKNTGKELWSYSLKSLPDDGKLHQDGNIMPYNNLLVVGWKQNLVAFH